MKGGDLEAVAEDLEEVEAILEDPSGNCIIYMTHRNTGIISGGTAELGVLTPVNLVILDVRLVLDLVKTDEVEVVGVVVDHIEVIDEEAGEEEEEGEETESSEEEAEDESVQINIKCSLAVTICLEKIMFNLIYTQNICYYY